MFFRALRLGVLLGVSFGLYFSRLYVSVVDGLLVIIERDPDASPSDRCTIYLPTPTGHLGNPVDG